ncbi:hypothetical protein AGABI2DRAFT_118335 [Agaricus bisporus var. bisporus H97]|uniref:hypothetical protein n=1 Tax=Agaricus bisporus var. bisporus (strain H97 / ATCC MYA-4626 / FGSC 10389) TaxID=936046 RepID=UPI00029F73DC|nr:hypothetical protein AGABI2DRAFT_118335 [Agaricus bisporus var. bisporus H97]EKV47795.1 hypothetical protein AGABI2DRAFT_118335 [Agaricus bisporus var. bisporus H97]
MQTTTRWILHHRSSKEGYEEIVVPAPKSNPVAGNELFPVSSRARKAFTVPRLSRVQSKLFLVVFDTDEPILLYQLVATMLTILNDLRLSGMTKNPRTIRP